MFKLKNECYSLLIEKRRSYAKTTNKFQVEFWQEKMHHSLCASRIRWVKGRYSANFIRTESCNENIYHIVTEWLPKFFFDYIFQTYTMQGTTKDPGVVIKSLHVLFKKIRRRQCEGMIIKPDSYSSNKRLRDDEEQTEIIHKNALLSSLDEEAC